MQCIYFEDSEIKDIEKKMFFFLWAKGLDTKKAIDRIKRKVLKNDRHRMPRQSVKIKT
jgi:hypothetical protein